MPLFPARSLLQFLTIGLLLSPITLFCQVDLKQQFQNPPAEFRPMVRWWWFGIAVEKGELLLELQQMKADGIGGAELAFVYPQVIDDPAKHLVNESFLSPAMLENVSYAAS